MGVDYFPCRECGEVICDAGDYDHCYACEKPLCQGCAEVKPEFVVVCQKCEHAFNQCRCGCSCEQSMRLIFCTKCSQPARPSRKNLLAFLLKQTGLSLAQAEAACLKDQGLKPTHCIFVLETTPDGVHYNVAEVE